MFLYFVGQFLLSDACSVLPERCDDLQKYIDILKARTLLETCGNQCFMFKARVKAAFRKFKGVECAKKSGFFVKFLELSTVKLKALSEEVKGGSYSSSNIDALERETYNTRYFTSCMDRWCTLNPAVSIMLLEALKVASKKCFVSFVLGEKEVIQLLNI